MSLYDKNEYLGFGEIMHYKLPLKACSRSMASNNALKFPFPKDLAPLR
jgi:hypothetical protein